GAVGQGRDAFDPGLGADVVDEDHRSPRDRPADAAPVSPELRDDLVVEAVDAVGGRVGHDLLRVAVPGVQSGSLPATRARAVATNPFPRSQPLLCSRSLAGHVRPSCDYAAAAT